jgi:methylated-DNA-[protein]-cysteine S-methyltransferase
MTTERLFIDGVASPIGTVTLVWDDAQVLRAAEFEGYDARMRRLLQRHYGALEPEAGRVPAALAEPIAAFFAGEIDAIDAIAVATNGTEFQQRVWAELRRIPPGTTTTYGALAAAIGRPDACRAVGLANGSNPIPIVVPCHRVIGSNGSLTGFGGGLDRKRWLLAHEQHFTQTQRRLFA